MIVSPDAEVINEIVLAEVENRPNNKVRLIYTETTSFYTSTIK